MGIDHYCLPCQILAVIKLPTFDLEIDPAFLFCCEAGPER
jgi:hypothetical protein